MEHQRASAIEKDFDEFFIFCQRENISGSKLHTICSPLTWRVYVKRAQRFAVLATIVAASLYWLYDNMDVVAWCASAVYRMLLIQLLPFWNWRPLYGMKCVLERDAAGANTVVDTYHEPNDANCVLCDSLEHVERVANVTFATLEAQYLERGHPVIVSDSHRPQALDQLLQLMLRSSTTDYLSYEPCDLLTNLMLPRFFDMELALQKLLAHATEHDRWFLRFRNCRSSAVKASRNFFARPYFYPQQLGPFYASWLLVSHNYQHNVPEWRFRLLGNLVIVSQLSGSFHVQLRPKVSCERICPVVNMHLMAGESLLFTTDLWTFSYDATALKKLHTSTATVFEIDWLL